MQKTNPFRPTIALGILDHIRRDSFQKQSEFQAAQADLQEASERLEIFRAANPEWPMAFSWTHTGKEKAALEANLWDAIRRRDHCRGAFDISTHYRHLIDQALDT
jgi:hypothetical protein